MEGNLAAPINDPGTYVYFFPSSTYRHRDVYFSMHTYEHEHWRGYFFGLDTDLTIDPEESRSNFTEMNGVAAASRISFLYVLVGFLCVLRTAGL